jgi:hypothetical protein
MNNAGPCGHPVDFAGMDRLAYTQAVAVVNLAIK